MLSTRAFPAQTRRVCFSSYSTKRFLSQRVSAYHQVKNLDYISKSQSIIAVSNYDSIDMSWKDFLRHYSVWYVAKVMDNPRLSSSTPFTGDISGDEIIISLDCLDNIPDVDTFDNYYYDYIKRDDITDMGYYAKDTYPPPLPIKVSVSSVISPLCIISLLS